MSHLQGVRRSDEEDKTVGVATQEQPPAAVDVPAETERSEMPLLVVVAALGMTSVVPLLAWVYDLSDFNTMIRWVALPGACALVMLGWLSRNGQRWPEVHSTLRLGVVAGVIGTLGYDLFRVPFIIVTRFGLLRPIESYGVLALDAGESSSLTAFAGWTYHFSNGIGFAISYMAFFRGRHWAWGLVWAMVLESGSVFTPFAQDYDLWSNPTAIVIAYGAHVPFGLALGIIGQNSTRWETYLDEAGRYVVPCVLAIGLATLALWLRPGSQSSPWQQGRSIDSGPSAIISDAVFSPFWLRTDECVRLHNSDSIPYTFPTAVGSPVLGPGSTSSICFSTGGVLRVNPTGDPDNGGFVILDQYAAGGQP